VKVPADVPEEHLVLLADVLPTAWQAVEYAEVPPGGTVVVMGLGPIGQMAARIARHRGAAQVIGIDLVDDRLAMARRHGIDTVDVRDVDDVTDAVFAFTGGGADSVIDAVGMEASGSFPEPLLQATKVQPDRLVALRNALGSVRRGGTVSIVGVYIGHYPLFPIGDLFDKQVTIRQGQANVRRWIDELVPLVADPSDPLGLADFVTHRRPLTEAPGAYDAFRSKADEVFKVVLDPWA
jgi:threonine dehydrogenase-like Zn-dependent dehydrogenase